MVMMFARRADSNPVHADGTGAYRITGYQHQPRADREELLQAAACHVRKDHADLRDPPLHQVGERCWTRPVMLSAGVSRGS
jgi:hypothetical protein